LGGCDAERCTSEQASIDEAEQLSSTIEKPSSLRSDGVRDHPGMSFGFLQEQAFNFPPPVE